MPYGIIKVDTVTFTDNGIDKNISLSGLVQNPTFTGNVTATGTISGDVIRGGTTISGVTVTGTTANFVSGVFTTQVSGVTVIATTGTFTSLTGTTTTGTTATFASGVFTTQVSGATVIATTGTFTSLTGTTTTGTTATFTSGVFTTQVSGATVIAPTGTFTSLTGTTATFTSGIIASGTALLPSLAILSDPNTGIFSPGADQLAVSTNGAQNLLIDASGNLIVSGTNASNTGAGRGNITINGTAGSILNFTVNGTDKGWIFHDNTNLTIQNTTANALLFNTGNNEGMRITSAGTVNIRGAGTAGSTQAVSFNGLAPINSLVMDSGGKVGLGTSSPKIELQTGTSGGIQAANTGEIAIRYNLYNSSGDKYIQAANKAASMVMDATGDFVFYNTNTASTAADSAVTGLTARMAIKASGNVGIGTTSPKSLLTVNGNIVGLSETTHSLQHYQQASSSFTVTSIDSVISGASGSLVFKTGTNWTNSDAIENMRIKSDGDVSIVTGNLIIGTSGKGIDFSADGNAAGMTSELLDDYEEGTWTPSDGSGAGRTFTNLGSSYVKIGRKVTVIAYFLADVSVSAAGFQVNGLPFTSTSTLGQNVGTFGSSTGTAGISTLGVSSTSVAVGTPATYNTNLTNTQVSNGGVAFTLNYLV